MTSTDPEPPPAASNWTRRRLLTAGIGGVVGVVGVAVAGFELVEHGVLPGKHQLDEIDGACSVSSPKLTFATPGPSHAGRFFSPARNRTVGYTIAYPPNHGPGDRLPLAMLVDELIPFCRRRGLGARPGTIGTIGISMGGYGSLLLAERHPQLISTVSAISPAVWTSYSQARSASPDGFASAADWATDDVIAHTARLTGTSVRIASGTDDPLHAGAVALAHALPRSAVVVFTDGCHDDAFFASQQHPSLAFLGEHLSVADRA